MNVWLAVIEFVVGLLLVWFLAVLVGQVLEVLFGDNPVTRAINKASLWFSENVVLSA